MLIMDGFMDLKHSNVEGRRLVKMNCHINVCLLVALFCCAGQLCAGDAFPTNALTGYFTWAGDKTGSRGVSTNKDGKMGIQMALTPTATNNVFKAAFHFLWDKHDQNWKGTFSRDPQTGIVTGDALRWTFKGKITDGTFVCQYFEVKNGKVGDVSDGEMVIKGDAHRNPL